MKNDENLKNFEIIIPCGNTQFTFDVRSISYKAVFETANMLLDDISSEMSHDNIEIGNIRVK